ncbi:hypothetical protein STEG23_035540 [Scotinomys teguina]
MAAAAAEQQQFYLLLGNLLSPDNVVRKQAEETYENIPGQSKITFLLQAIRNTTAAEEDHYTEAIVNKKYFTDLKCESKNVYIETDQHFVYTGNLNFPGIFGNQQQHYLDVIKRMLVQCMQDQEHPSIRTLSARATAAFILANEHNVALFKHFADLLPGFLQLCGDTNLNNMQRQLALEVIVTLSETAAAMLRKHTNIVAQTIPQMLAMMVDLEEDEDWANADELEDDDFDSNAVAGESALDRMACGLGGKLVLPMIKEHIMQMLQNPDWKYRHAGLMALSAIGEGCHQQMEGILNEIVNFVLLFLQDPHPRVRYAACNAVGQMATDFAPGFQKKFHEKVIAALLQTMEDQGNQRVQAHAAAALINFTEDCPKSLLIPYLDSLVKHLHSIMVLKLQELIQKGTKLVLEQVVTSIASVADTAEEKFVPYYDLFMPSLKHIVENAVQKELRLLRGKTIECISLIGLAVGKEKFMQDASDVMQLLKTQTDFNDMEDDDPQVCYAKELKEGFVEYTEQVVKLMVPLLKFYFHDDILQQLNTKHVWM